MMRTIYLLPLFLFISLIGFSQVKSNEIRTDSTSIVYQFSSDFKFLEQVFAFDNHSEREVGPAISFHSNGNLKVVSFLLDGFYVGPYLYYDESGKLIEKGFYLFNKEAINHPIKHNVDTEFVGSKPIAFTTHSYKFPKFGKWSEWYFNGNLKSEGEYNFDPNNFEYFKIGEWRFYKENGDLDYVKSY